MKGRGGQKIRRLFGCSKNIPYTLQYVITSIPVQNEDSELKILSVPLFFQYLKTDDKHTGLTCWQTLHTPVLCPTCCTTILGMCLVWSNSLDLLSVEKLIVCQVLVWYDKLKWGQHKHKSWNCWILIKCMYSDYIRFRRGHIFSLACYCN